MICLGEGGKMLLKMLLSAQNQISDPANMANMADKIQDSILAKTHLETFSLDMLTKAGEALVTFLGKIVIAILILIIGFRLVHHTVRVLRKIFEKSKIDPTLETFLLSFSGIGMKVLVVFAAIAELGIGVSSILALVGSAGLAIVLSLQGSLSNIAGGVVLLFVKPFEVGDYIAVQDSDKEGTVKSIGILYTRLLTLDNHLVMIPNGSLVNATIENLTHQRERMEEIIVGIEYSEDIQRVREVIKEVIEKDPDYLPEHSTNIFVKSYEESAINIAARYWVLSENYWPSRWRSLENIKNAFDKNSITIPFNQVDVNFYNQRSTSC